MFAINIFVYITLITYLDRYAYFYKNGVKARQWHTPVIPALKRQEDHKFEANLIYITRLSPKKKKKGGSKIAYTTLYQVHCSTLILDVCPYQSIFSPGII
jgi:hypothetical protein